MNTIIKFFVIVFNLKIIYCQGDLDLLQRYIENRIDSNDHDGHVDDIEDMHCYVCMPKEHLKDVKGVFNQKELSSIQNCSTFDPYDSKYIVKCPALYNYGCFLKMDNGKVISRSCSNQRNEQVHECTSVLRKQYCHCNSSLCNYKPEEREPSPNIQYLLSDDEDFIHGSGDHEDSAKEIMNFLDQFVTTTVRPTLITNLRDVPTTKPPTSSNAPKHNFMLNSIIFNFSLLAMAFFTQGGDLIFQ